MWLQKKKSQYNFDTSNVAMLGGKLTVFFFFLNIPLLRYVRVSSPLL